MATKKSSPKKGPSKARGTRKTPPARVHSKRPTRPQGPLSLHATRGELFLGDLRQEVKEQCEVTAVIAGTTTPVPGAAVRYRVIRGPVHFTGDRTEQRVRTNELGRATVDLSFVHRGAAFIVAELESGEGTPVYFDGHSDARTHVVYLYAAPTFLIDPGIARVRISAVDQHDRAVTGAKLLLSGLHGRGTEVTGTVREIGRGEYEGELHVTEAGEWTLAVSDLETKATGSMCMWALPGSPAHIRLEGETDPRRAHPYGRVLLRARLEDGKGNALDPHRIRAQLNGRSVEPSAIVGDEARFPVAVAGYGSVNALFTDVESRIRHETTIQFSAAWIGNPGLVLAEKRFSTPVYWLPPIDRPVATATVRMTWQDLARFVTFTAASDAPVRASHAVKGSMLSITLNSDQPVNAANYPDGIFLGTCEWECLGEGECCFDLVAIMSPVTEGWKLCVKQKRENVQCICVNVLYQAGSASAAATLAAANRIADLIGQLGNVERCCPVVRVEVHNSPISAADWTANIAPSLTPGGGANPAGETQLRDNGFGQLTRCINFLIVPLAFPDGRTGSTYRPGSMGGRARGFGIISPAGLAADPNIAGHEAGHALDLPDVPNDDNLMGPHYPSGVNLTAPQCETIWQNLSRYAC